jgi:hypothetical protein
VAVIGCVLFARLALVASQTEVGWQTVAAQWRDGALAWTGWISDPVSEREPVEQARFWIAEADRIITGNPDSPAIQIGAAWMLDSPNIEFMQHHVQQSEYASAMPQMGLELDEESISYAKAQFRDLCVERCVALAARATELDPGDPRWWRMRALLLFEGDSLWSGHDFEPRSDNWLEVLDDCLAHDKDNALYDYLAAMTLWKQSAVYDMPEDGQNDDLWLLNVTDAKRFAAGTERFLKAQEREYLAIGEEGYAAITTFLDASRLSKKEQASAAISRLVTFRHSTFFHKLWRWQQVRADAASRDGDFSLAIQVLQQNLRLYEQAIIPAETSALNVLTTFAISRTSTYDAIQKLAEDSPESISQADLTKLRGREEELRIESATLLLALQKLDDETYPKSNWASVPSIVSWVASTSSALLLFVGALLLTLARLLTRDTQPIVRLGAARQAIVWILGCGGSYIVLGMAPAELINHDVQTRAIVVAVWIGALCVVGAAVWLVVVLSRRGKFRFRLTTLFAITTAVAVLASLWPLMEPIFSRIAESSPELWLPAKGWNGIDAEVLRTAMKVGVGTWLWATIQWFAFGGLYVGLLTALVLSGCWLMWLNARNSSSSLFTFRTREARSKWASLLGSVGQSALGASLFWLIVYLYFAPPFLREAEAQYQHQMRYCRDPRSHWAEIREAQATVKSSASAMETIREQVQFDLSDEDVLEHEFAPD